MYQINELLDGPILTKPIAIDWTGDSFQTMLIKHLVKDSEIFRISNILSYRHNSSIIALQHVLDNGVFKSEFLKHVKDENKLDNTFDPILYAKLCNGYLRNGTIAIDKYDYTIRNMISYGYYYIKTLCFDFTYLLDYFYYDDLTQFEYYDNERPIYSNIYNNAMNIVFSRLKPIIYQLIEMHPDFAIMTEMDGNIRYKLNYKSGWLHYYNTFLSTFIKHCFIQFYYPHTEFGNFNKISVFNESSTERKVISIETLLIEDKDDRSSNNDNDRGSGNHSKAYFNAKKVIDLFNIELKPYSFDSMVKFLISFNHSTKSITSGNSEIEKDSTRALGGPSGTKLDGRKLHRSSAVYRNLIGHDKMKKYVQSKIDSNALPVKGYRVTDKSKGGDVYLMVDVTGSTMKDIMPNVSLAALFEKIVLKYIDLTLKNKNKINIYFYSMAVIRLVTITNKQPKHIRDSNILNCIGNTTTHNNDELPVLNDVFRDLSRDRFRGKKKVIFMTDGEVLTKYNVADIGPIIDKIRAMLSLNSNIEVLPVIFNSRLSDNFIHLFEGYRHIHFKNYADMMSPKLNELFRIVQIKEGKNVK